MELGEDNCGAARGLIDYLDDASAGSLRKRGEITLTTIKRDHEVDLSDERIHRVTDKSILD